MVAFNRTTDLPANIVTLEQLIAWSMATMNAIAPDLLISEIAGSSPELVVSCSPFPVLTDPADYHVRLIYRASIRLSNDWNTGKIWLAAQQLSTKSIPAAYKQV